MKRKSLVFCAPLALSAVVILLNSSDGLGQSSKPELRTSPTPTPTPTRIRDEDVIYKVDTELVNLNVRVVDRNSRPVNNLRKEEFKVLEDNVPQLIEFFSKSEVPTNYTLVIDNSRSLLNQLDKVIEAGKILVNTNRPDDETSVIRFVSREKISIEQPFTSSKAELAETLDNLFIEGGQTALRDAVYLAAQRVDEYEKSDRSDDRKRRALVLITDGEDRDSYYNEKQLFDLLRESDVQIYAIGLITDLSKEGGFISKSPQGKAKTFLERLATETGGKSYFPTTAAELPALASEIASELRTQYSIGYIPSNDVADGTFRNIKVLINDGPNSQKRIAITKAGRTADKASTEPDKKN